MLWYRKYTRSSRVKKTQRHLITTVHNSTHRSRPGVPKSGVATPNGVGMITMWDRNEVMGSVGSLKYRQGMSVQSAQTRGKGHIEIQCLPYIYSIELVLEYTWVHVKFTMSHSIS